MNILKRRKPAQHQRGLTLVMTALMLFVLLIMAALAIDLGIAYTGRTSAQHAADAAALSGALTWHNAKAGAADETTRIAEATRDGAAVGNRYKILGHQVAISTEPNTASACDTGSNIICVDAAKDRVIAVVQAPVQTYFAKIVPAFSLLQVRARAVAEAGPAAAGERCIKPLYISNDAISIGAYGAGLTPEQKCAAATAAGDTILNADGSITEHALTYRAQQEFKKAYIDDTTGCTGLGCPIELWDQGTSNPSHFGLIDFSMQVVKNESGELTLLPEEGNGEQVLSCTMGSCLLGCQMSKPLYRCGEPVVGMKTGQSVGQVIPELPDAIEQAGETPTNVYDRYNEYNDGYRTSDTSDAIVPVVVWDCRKPLTNGTHTPIEVIGLARLFINGVHKKNQGDTTAFLVDAVPCSGSGTVGNGAVPVRLINTD